ncbi:MAG: amino acid adenylation domain-containing protein, partial [Myxococcales bacterium]|nr:amino acid adenylation domain-containing protein [Myxococcales bacterium]
GSTSQPRGVMVTHDNLLQNERMIREAFGHDDDTVFVSWLPLYHDMGLIGGVLQPLYLGVPCYLMSPLSFLQRPIRWLEAITRFRGTTSGGPNFAFDLCTRRIPESERSALDLSSWRVAFNGAEPVKADSLRRFSETYAPYGFRAEAFYPCYGLAEATLLVTGGSPAHPPILRDFDREALEAGRAVHADMETTGSRAPLVSCGQSWGDEELVVVDPAHGQVCAERTIGEIWVRGRNVSPGYWRDPTETETHFCAKLAGPDRAFLRTGDLGFLDGGELFVTGRLKDLIIVRGRNHYPQDLEWTAEASHRALRAGCSAAFTAEDDGEERLVVVCEAKRELASVDTDEVAAAVRHAVSLTHQLEVATVVLLAPGTIPKTSSGKIQRRACKARFLGGTLEVIGTSRRPMPSSRAVDPPTAAVLDELQRLDPVVREGAIESLLRGAISRILGLAEAHVPSRRSLAQLGLDSLGVVELANQVEDELGLRLTPTMVLENDVAALAVELARRIGEGSHIPRTLEVGHADAPRISLAQERMWFAEQLDPGTSRHNVAVGLRLEGPLNRAVLTAALADLLERHEVLRSSFREVDGKPHVRVAARSSVEPRWVEAGSPSEVEAAVRVDLARSFELDSMPLVRITVIEQDPETHLVVIVSHHIICDGWSLGVLIGDLVAAYRRRSGLSPDPPRPLSTTYYQWAAFERGQLAGDRLDGEIAFWSSALAEAPSSILSPDAPRASAGQERARRSFQVPSTVGTQLGALARTEGTTWFVTLLSALQVLLWRYSQQEDIVVATPVANRELRAVERLVGLFVNTIAIRGSLAGAPPFRDLLRRARARCLEALQHQSLPFDRIVEALGRQGSSHGSAPLQVLLSVQPALEAVDIGGGLRLVPYEIEGGWVPFELSMSVRVEADGALTGYMEYDAGRFESVTIQRLLGSWLELLTQIAVDPDRSIASYDLEPPEGGPAGGGGSPRAYSCVVSAFDERATQSPDTVAVRDERGCLTYGELGRRASDLASSLRERGVADEDVVAVCMPPGNDVAVALLGVLEAGAAVLPIDTGCPPERLEQLLADSRAVALVTAGGPAPPSVPVVVLASVERARSTSMRGRREHPARALAYAIYTSGTTGQPRGVAVEHGALANHARAMIEQYRLSTEDRVLQFASLGFDVALEELIPTWLAGASVQFRSSGELVTPAEFARYVEREEVTIVNLPASYWHLWVDELARGAPMPARLRLVIVGSEPVSPIALTRWYTHTDGRVELACAYGPTEATITSTLYWPRPSHDQGSWVAIGSPIASTEGYVLDGHGARVPPGAVGELFLASLGLARGSLGRPARLTAERFLPDPFSTEPGQRMYRTAHLVRYRPDGALEFLGRTDHQVKIRGYRIELGEVESVLRSFHGVHDVVVDAQPGPDGNPRLVAYLAPPVGVDRLRAHARRRLPDYMVPQAIVELSALPRLPNGKVDRKRLPKPRFESAHVRHVPARTPIEAILVSLWEDVLDHSPVGIHD